MATQMAFIIALFFLVSWVAPSAVAEERSIASDNTSVAPLPDGVAAVRSLDNKAMSFETHGVKVADIPLVDTNTAGATAINARADGTKLNGTQVGGTQVGGTELARPKVANSKPKVDSADADNTILKVRYPSVFHPYYTKRDVYYVTLIRMALERSGERFELSGVDLPEYSEKRSVLLLQSNHYDVHWLNTTPEREQQLLPIRVPLDKGAIGWRTFLIRPELQERLAKVNDPSELKSLVFVQGHDWPDVPILRFNGFNVESTSNWQSLFKMVELDRAQVLPRSIVEIYAEQEEDVAQNLMIEKKLLLTYPAAYYFFVSKNNVRLAQALERGLKKSMEDGSFDQLFYETFGAAIAKLNLSERKVLKIHTPNFVVDNEQLWFSIEWFESVHQKYQKNTAAGSEQ